MGDELKITIVQPDIIWEDIDANLQLYDTILKDIPDSHLIVLPEMFASGFTMNTSFFSNETNKKITDWIKTKVNILSSSLIASTGYFENNNYYNRLFLFDNEGKQQGYDKRHLFNPEKENQFYVKGNKRKTLELKGWKILPQICYDLRFPVWSRNNIGYDLIIYVANWPEKRDDHWLSLLKARAIENQAYVVGVNRIGKDGNHIHYKGNSCGYSYDGKLIFCLEDKINITCTINLSKKKLLDYRKNFNVLKDMDDFSIQV